MNKIRAIFKQLLKLTLWVALCVVLLFVLIALLIQLPAVQTKLTGYAISFVSSKTHTRVALQKISISFPKSLILQGLYLEDLQKDTLLFAGEVKVNLAFRDLLRNRIHLNSVALEEVNLKMNRTESDSLFNFNFLLTAFGDTVSQKKEIPEKKSAWTFRIDKVEMKSIRLHFDDAFGGTDAAVYLKHLKLTMDGIDLAKSMFDVDELLVEQLRGTVLIQRKTGPEEEASTGNLPVIKANRVQINDTYLSYGDSTLKQSVVAAIFRLELADASIDLEKQQVSSSGVLLSKSDVKYRFSQQEPIPGTIAPERKTGTADNDWMVSVKRIEFDDNALSYMEASHPVIKNAFDVNHMQYRNLTLLASDFYYSPVKTEVYIEEFTTTDQNNFSVEHCNTDFRMDRHSIRAQQLKIKTTNSEIDADINLQFSSLASLQDSLRRMIVNLDMRNVKVRNSEIVYFNSGLFRQPFFRNPLNMTTISGKVSGPVNQLTGENLVIQTGSKTILKTDFVISGLPLVQTAHYNFPNLTIQSGRKDLTMILGPVLPDSIELPENIGLRIYFNGRIKSFVSTLAMNSSFGSANVAASVGENEKFSGKASLKNFDLGRLLKNTTMYGPVSLTAGISGHGLDKKSIRAKITADGQKIFFNQYTYHNLKVDGAISGMEFNGLISLNDQYAAFDFDGLVNLNPGEEQYRFTLNLKGANLMKLHLTKDDTRISMMAMSDLKGGSASEINGQVGITKIYIARGDKEYLLESFLMAAINEPKKSGLTVNSALVGIQYHGTFSPAFLTREISRFLNNYFPFSAADSMNAETEPQVFNFEIQLHNHPILSEIFLPQLKEFEPGLITGSFDSQKRDMRLTAGMKKIVYGTTEIRNLTVDVSSDVNALNYKITSHRISGPQFNLDNFLIGGKLADKTILATISSVDDKLSKKLFMQARLVKENASYRLTIDPGDFYLMNDRWDIAPDNYIAFGKEGFLIHHLNFNKADSHIDVTSVHDRYNDDLSISIKKFKLDDISGIIAKDTSLIKGTVDGDVLLKRVNKSYGLIADIKATSLVVREVPIGDLSVKAENPDAQKFILDVNLSGTDNNISANGYFIPKGGENSINIKASVKSLSLRAVEAFSMGTIKEASGRLTGSIAVEGNTDAPDITGELTFNDAFLKPSVLNNVLQLKHETIQLKKDGLYFNAFTILDPNQQKSTIDGTVKMEHFKNFIFALQVNTHDFLLFNTTSADNREFYGRMIIDSRISIRGPMSLPVVDAKIKMKEGSNFTFAVPEDKLTTYKGEDVVVFDNAFKNNPILEQDSKVEEQSSGFTGFEVSSIIEVDKEATLRLLMDPTSSDSLVVRGEAALNLTIDQSGKMSLTGAYNLNDGSYLVTLESVVKRKFDIDPGSTIIWNGDPVDADISINAIYTVRASPIDLVADQMAGLSESDKNTYKQRYPFLVVLKLRGEILHPVISFEIQLPPEDKGIFGGAVNAKLNMLNEDPSALNKQVFALLVLGRFIQENPLQSEANNGVSTVVRTTVGKFLSAQLNQLSSKIVPGVELNFDVQSYEDYESGVAEGRTQVDIGAKKQLFNERLTVQVGGVVDVEGEKVKQNSAGTITSDVTIEYKLTTDGRYRLKGFSHNQYEGAIEGQLVETGFGVMYVRDFNKWKEFFRAPKKKKDSSKTQRR